MSKRAEPTRCHWAAADDALMCAYHDTEWGVPLHDDRGLFEFLCLEGAQAGLSWRTVLAKRAHYRKLFHDFEIPRVAAMSDRELEKVLLDPGIIRNRLKVYSARDNARAAQSELAGYWNHKFNPNLRLQAYALAGFTDGSPDYGVGASVKYSF